MLRRPLDMLSHVTSKLGAGGLVLKTRVWLSRSNDPQTEFATLWRFANNIRWFFAFRQHLANPFQVPWHNFLFLRIINIVQDKYPSFTPTVNIHSDGSVWAMCNPHRPVVLITVHNAISPSIILALEERGVRASMIVYQYPAQLLDTLRCGAEIDVIYRSKQTFLQARQKLRDGSCIVCCADESVDGQLWMRPGIFEFARRMEAQVLFGAAQVSRTGEIDITIEQAHSRDKSSEAMAEDFIEFLNAVLISKKTWKIGGADRGDQPSPRG